MASNTSRFSPQAIVSNSLHAAIIFGRLNWAASWDRPPRRRRHPSLNPPEDVVALLPMKAEMALPPVEAAADAEGSDEAPDSVDLYLGLIARRNIHGHQYECLGSRFSAAGDPR